MLMTTKQKKRRKLPDRRVYSYSVHIPECRKNEERRIKIDRRKKTR